MASSRGPLPLVVRNFLRLKTPKAGQSREHWIRRNHRSIEHFSTRTARRYSEATLLRVLESHDPQAREAALFALGLLGSWNCNASLARFLHDDEDIIREVTVESLWRLWFRGTKPNDYVMLQQALALADRETVLKALNAVVLKRPDFAEAWNQRAIIHFQNRHFAAAARDCMKVIRLNPFHFGALAGLANCLMHLDRHAQALKAFRRAQRIHPFMEGVASTIRLLEQSLRDDRPNA